MTLDPEKQNTMYIKFAGKANIPETLAIGDNYDIHIKGTVVSAEEKDNNDGSHSIFYKVEPVTVEMVDNKGRSIKSKDTRSNSQRTRAWFYKAWLNAAATYEFDHLWDTVNAIFCARRDEIIDEAEKRMGV